jgi:hypothetical protein
MKNLQQLKNFMSTAKTVNEWNEKRESAKDLYPIELIQELDSSGYIKELLS